jgi:cytochrome c oxidase subunit 3/cytochrome o ubiquinol oxidase subunit 3
LTILLGLEFLIGTGVEWYGLIVHHGLWIGTNLFGTTFYSLVGFHALHVFIGLSLLSLVLIFALGGQLNRARRVPRSCPGTGTSVDTVWIVSLSSRGAEEAWLSTSRAGRRRHRAGRDRLGR